MKSLLYGVTLLIIVGIAGFFYRTAVEHPYQPGTCPVDTLICPDGSTVSRTGAACEFPACPPPNVSFPDLNLTFAVPEGYVETTYPDAAVLVAYEKPPVASSTLSSQVITVRRFAVPASSTPFAVIRETAIGGTSGEPLPPTFFTSTVLGGRQYTMVSIDRFEAIIDTAYYLARGTDVLRFDAIDRDVFNWTNPNLNVTTLPANAALRSMLSTLQAE